jgi:hypothetical protein
MINELDTSAQVVRAGQDEHFDDPMRAHDPVQCSRCAMRELCIPGGLSETEMRKLDKLVAARIKVARGSWDSVLKAFTPCAVASLSPSRKLRAVQSK